MGRQENEDVPAPDFYSIHPPLDVLKPFLRRILIADAEVPDGFLVRAAPTGYNYIGWHASGHVEVRVDGVATRYGRFHFAGQLRGQNVEVLHTGQVVHIIAEFTATGLARLIHIPGAAIFGRPVPVADIAPACARALAPLLEVRYESAEARSAAFQNVLASFVEDAAPPVHYLEQAVEAIERAAGLVRIGELSRELGVSQRHLSRVFGDVVGIGPKYFAKVVQLNTALGALLSGEQAQISKVSYGFGYTDQAHFVHVMQELLRMGPTAFLNSNDDVLAAFLAKSQAFARE